MRYFSLALSILFFNLFGSALIAQKEIKLDEYLEPTTKKQYAYLRTLKKEKDSWAFTDRATRGPILQKGYFKEEEMKTRVGHFIFYLDGKKLYEGNYVDGAPNGTWYFYEGKKLDDSLFYAEPLIKTDSISKTEGSPYMVDIKTSKDPDSLTFVRVDVESKFPGGEIEWTRYLMRTLRFPMIVLETMKPFTKRCEVQFIVCTDGTICDVQAITSVHPLLDLQAVNAIRKGPSWIPAEQNHRKVKSYKRQPVVFGVTTN